MAVGMLPALACLMRSGASSRTAVLAGGGWAWSCLSIICSGLISDTLDLLRHLVSSQARSDRRGVNFLWLVGAYRPEEAAPNSHLLLLRQSLEQKGQLNRVTLGPLADAAVRQIAGSLTNHPELADYLVREGEGSPFLLGELVKEMQETGCLVLTADGTWHLAHLPSKDKPGAVRELTLQRILRLAEPEQRVLRLAAVSGEPFEPGALAETIGETGDSLAQIFARLQERRILRTDENGRLTFGQEQVRAALYESLSVDLRKLLHERVGQALFMQSMRTNVEAGSRSALLVDRVSALSGEQAARIAYHYERCFDPTIAAPFLARAAEAARLLNANQTALDAYRRLLTMLRPQERPGVMIDLGLVWQAMGRWGDADECFRQAVELSTGSAPHPALIRARGWYHLSNVRDHLGDPPGALECARHAEEEALSAEDEGLPVRVSALISQGWAFFRLGELLAALDLGTRARPLASATGAWRILASCLDLLSAVYTCLGRFAEGKACLDQYLDLKRRAGHQTGEIQALNKLGDVAFQRGDFLTAYDYFSEALNLARSIERRDLELQSLHHQGGALVALGQAGLAEKVLKRVLEMLGDEGWYLMPETYRFLAEAYSSQGKYEEALAAAREALKLSETSHHRQYLAAAWRALGRIALAAGQVGLSAPDARACFEISVKICDETGLPAERAWTVLGWGISEYWYGDRARGADLLAQAHADFTRLGMLWPAKE